MLLLAMVVVVVTRMEVVLKVSLNVVERRRREWRGWTWRQRTLQTLSTELFAHRVALHRNGTKARLLPAIHNA